MLMATQGPGVVVGITAMMLAFDFAAVAMRFKARRVRSQPLKADDWLALFALLLTCGLASTLFIGVAQKALGYPTPPLPPMVPRSSLENSTEKIQIVARLQYIFLVISIPTLGAIKLSFLFFYRRIFVIEKSNLRNMQNIMYIVIMAIIGIWTCGFCFTFMFACKGDFDAWWHSALSLMTKCIDTLSLVYAFAISDFISDVIIILLPIPMILGLHLPWDRKLGVLFIFLLGILATVASLIRMIWIIWVRHIGWDPSLDQNLATTTMLFWCMIEVSMGIIACCLPTFRGLFKNKSMDSFMQSVRSRITLRSDRGSSTHSITLKQIPSNDSAQDTKHSVLPASTVDQRQQPDIERGNIHYTTEFALNDRNH